MRRNAKTSASTGRATLAILMSLASVATVGAVPTSVLADSKAANDVTTSPGMNRLGTDDVAYGDDKPTNPQKRGVNPLLYREAELRNDFSGNSIPQNGVWEDVEMPLQGMPYPLELFDGVEPGPLERAGQPRTYDVLQSLLNRPSPYNPLLLAGPPPGPGGFPALRLRTGHPYGERMKRTSSVGGAGLGPGKARSHLMRLKRNTNKLSPAEVFSLLALMDSRDPYRPLPSLPDYAPDASNDMLAYAPNGLYPDVPFPMALEQLLGGRGMGPNGPSDGYAYEDAGEWMNSWTDPSVDYLGLPMADLDSLGSLNDGKAFGPANGYLPQKRFMVSKKKRSVKQALGTPVPVAAGCKAGDAACGSYHHGTIQAAA